MVQIGTASRCYFLELSGELRNIIYRLVFCNSDPQSGANSKCPIWVSEYTITQPALLRTCFQIRTEATSIYYLENAFDVHCSGFDPRNMILLLRQAKGLKIATEVHDYEVAPKWANLFKWLEAYYNGEAGRLDELWAPHGEEELWNAVAKMFDMVDLLKKCGLSWCKVKEALELTRDVAVLSGVWEWDD